MQISVLVAVTVLLIELAQLVLIYKQVYGLYPWEQAAQA